MAELEIKISTKTELAGAQQAAASLEKAIGAAKVMGKETGAMEAQLAKAKGAIDAFKKANDDTKLTLAGLSEKLREVVPGFARLQDLAGALGSGALGLVAAGLTAIAAAAKVAASGVREYAEAQDRVAKLDAALAQSGQLTESYREKLQELANTMQRASGIADDEWLGVLTRLTQFGADETNIEKYTQAVANLAGIMGGDIQGAALAMSRAMQGSFQMFSRYGIVLDENASKTEKLKQLMETLALRGGGQLEASTKTLTGQWKQFTLATEDALKGIGALIASTGVLQKGLEMIGNAAEWWADVLETVIPKVDGLENAATKTTQSIEGQSEAMAKATEEAERYKQSMDDAAEATKKLDDIEKERMAHEDKMDALAKRQEMAVVKAKQKSGAIDEFTAIGLEASIEAKYAGKKFTREQAYDAKKAAAAKVESDRLIAESRQDADLIAEQESRVAVAKEKELRESRIAGFSGAAESASGRISQREADANAAWRKGQTPFIKRPISQAEIDANAKDSAEASRYRTLAAAEQEKLRMLGASPDLGTASEEEAILARIRTAQGLNQPLRDKGIQRTADEYSARQRGMRNRSEEYGYEGAARNIEGAAKVSGAIIDEMNKPGGQVNFNTRAIQAQQRRYAQEVAAFGGDIEGMFAELSQEVARLRQKINNSTRREAGRREQ